MTHRPAAAGPCLAGPVTAESPAVAAMGCRGRHARAAMLFNRTGSAADTTIR